jgi:ribosomal protein S18 acetylase RimI-like enzyme
MITYSTARTKKELQQILDLQLRNLGNAVTADEATGQGFLTARFDLHLLDVMCGSYGHIIAKQNEQVVGYCLVMLREFSNAIPILVPMFQQFDRLVHEGKRLPELNYFVMGQVCVDKDFRGQGIFNELYNQLRLQMQDHFELVVTEIATRNTRSQKAHSNTGFKKMNQYISPEGESWEIVYWDWK